MFEWLNAETFGLFALGFVQTFIATIFSASLACFVAFYSAVRIHTSQDLTSRVLSLVSNTLRGLPFFSLLILCYFGLPSLLQDTWLWFVFQYAWFCGLLAMGLNSWSYSTKLFKTSLENVDSELAESASALCFSPQSVYTKVLRPVIFATSLPALRNEFIWMMHASALLSSITISELVYTAKSVAARHYAFIEPYIVAGIFYFITAAIIRLFIIHFIGKYIACSPELLEEKS